MEALQLAFDYQQFDTETRNIVQQRTNEIKALMKRTAQDIIEIGEKLIDVKERLGHGHFGGWLKLEFDWTWRTADNYMNVAIRFKLEIISNLNISPTVLYLLAAPSIPDEARQEAIERAQNGESITRNVAKEIVNDHKGIEWLNNPATWHRSNSYTSPLFADDPELDAALADESKSVCLECGQVYDGPACPDCHPQNGNRMSQSMEILLSHKSVEYYTPIEIIEAARTVLGQIDLDPASCNEAQQTVRATRFYTADMDGLVQEWPGRVWLNPPYSKTNGQSNQELWAKKLLQEYRNGNVTAAVLLVKSALGYKWFEQLWDELPACFARQRMSFTKSDGTNDGESKHGTTLFYLGNDLPRFIDIFSRIGRITTPDGRYFNGNKFSLPESTE